MSDNKGTFYTSQEIFEVFKEQHRLFSPLDPMADPRFIMQPDSSIGDWRDAMDLLEWHDLAQHFNAEFGVDIPMSSWKSVLEPSFDKPIWGVCTLLSEHAIKEVIEPVRIFGHECLTAAVFFRLKQKLGEKGANVSALRPSTPLADYRNHFGQIVSEATLSGAQTFDKIELEKFPEGQGWKYIIDFFLPDQVFQRRLLTGDVVTFRDLVKRIVEARPLGTARITSAPE
jgi:hypothetical protein